jgi:hypothetical protein
MFAVTSSFFALFYFVYPAVFPPGSLPWAFLVTFVTVNVSAIALSWVYFDRTRCYEDEGNPVAKILYYIFGHDVAHLILSVFRWASAVIFFISLFGLDVTVFGTKLAFPAQDRLFLSIPIAIFAAELAFNIYAIQKHWNDRCEKVDPMVCPCEGDEDCYCDEVR